MDTPFQCGGSVQTFPSLKPGQTLLIRVESGSFLVYGSLDRVPTTTKGDFYLSGGEAIEIKAVNNTQVRIINATNDPKIFWFIR